MNKKRYRHMFSASGMYIGCREVTMLDYIKPYLWIAFGIGIIVGLVSVVIHDNNAKISKLRTQIVLEVPTKFDRIKTHHP